MRREGLQGVLGKFFAISFSSPQGGVLRLTDPVMPHGLTLCLAEPCVDRQPSRLRHPALVESSPDLVDGLPASWAADPPLAESGGGDVFGGWTVSQLACGEAVLQARLGIHYVNRT